MFERPRLRPFPKASLDGLGVLPSSDVPPDGTGSSPLLLSIFETPVPRCAEPTRRKCPLQRHHGLPQFPLGTF